MLQVSFYSYKGGAGRSTTSWNTIQRLVDLMKPSVENPFIIVDTDVESAGSTFLYRAKNQFFKSKESIQQRIKIGEKDYTSAGKDEQKKFFKSMHPVGKTFFGLSEEEDRAVLFIGVDLDKNALIGMDTTKRENFSNIVLACEDCGAKALFFDTPSGTQDLARHSIQESNIIVCCMRPTRQFREGTRGQLIEFIRDDKKKDELRKYILTPTTICVDEKQELIKYKGSLLEYPKVAKEEIEKTFNTENIDEDDSLKQIFKERVIRDMLDPTPGDIKKFDVPEKNVFGIPEVKRFKWFEECLGRLSVDELSDNDKMGFNRYEYLAKIIFKHYEKQP